MADPNFRLTKGTLIDTQPGFVDAFNYVYENVNGLKGGQGVELDKSLDGAWQINAYEYEGEESGGGGAVSADAVYDVVAGRRGSRNGLSVQYTDARPEKFIQFDTAVSNITRISSDWYGDKLSVDFTNGTSKQIDLYTELSGNVNSNTIKNTAFRFASASDSNIKVNVGSNNVIQIGAYYI